MDDRIIKSFALLLLISNSVSTSPKIYSKFGGGKTNTDKRTGVSKKTLRQGLPSSIELDPNRDVYNEFYKGHGEESKQSLADLGSNYDRSDVTEDDNDDDETEDSVSEIDVSDESETRSLAVGDIFTPREMLVISKKLMAKVENPGRGKGIISSARNPYQLTDRLFEAFFRTVNRIVTITEEDIPGLDALQALALSGDAVSKKLQLAPDESEIETLAQYIDGNQTTELHPLKCHYKLLRKEVETSDIEDETNRRQGKHLKEKLAKKRKLIVNRGRRQGRLGRVLKKARSLKKRFKKLVFGRSSHRARNERRNAKPGSICRWRYGCENPANLRTCLIKAICLKDMSLPFDAIKPPVEENIRTLRRYRNNGEAIDEEVEKILKSKIMTVQPEDSKLIESLNEYFNKIIIDKEVNTPMALNAEDVTKSEQKLLAPEKEALKGSDTDSAVKLNGGQLEDEDAEARRILGLPYRAPLLNKPDEIYYVFSKPFPVPGKCESSLVCVTFTVHRLLLSSK